VPNEQTRRTKFIVAVILVNDKNKSNLPKLERLQTLNMDGVRIRQNDTVTDVYLNLLADGRIRHRNANATINGWETDAYLMAITFPNGADMTNIDTASRLFIADGSYLRRDGKVIVDSLSKVFMTESMDDKKISLLLQGQPNGVLVEPSYDSSSQTFAARAVRDLAR
jgi:hypothetical protein